jgi:hypothetical protein
MWFENQFNGYLHNSITFDGFDNIRDTARHDSIHCRVESSGRPYLNKEGPGPPFCLDLDSRFVRNLKRQRVRSSRMTKCYLTRSRSFPLDGLLTGDESWYPSSAWQPWWRKHAYHYKISTDKSMRTGSFAEKRTSCLSTLSRRSWRFDIELGWQMNAHIRQPGIIISVNKTRDSCNKRMFIKPFTRWSFVKDETRRRDIPKSYKIQSNAGARRNLSAFKLPDTSRTQIWLWDMRKVLTKGSKN